MRTHYLIVWIDKKTEKVLTCNFTHGYIPPAADKAVPAILFSTETELDNEAETIIKKQLKNTNYSWVLNYLA